MNINDEQLIKSAKEQSAFTSYFLKPFRTAYYVDLDTNEAIVHKNAFNPEKEGTVIKDYFDSMERKTNSVVFPEDREGLKETMTPSNIRARLKKDGVLMHTFRDTLVGHERSVRIEIFPGADDSHIAVGFRDVTDEVTLQQEKDRLQKVAQEAMEVSHRLQDEVMKGMLDVDGLFLINCEKDTRKTIRDNSHSTDITDEEKHSESFERYINTFVHEDDREKMRQAIKPMLMLERLRQEKEYKVEYREMTTGVPVWFEMRLVRFSDTEALQGFRKCDDEVVARMVREKLVDEYDALYVVDLAKDEIRPARSSRVSKVGDIKEKTSYTQLARKFADTVVPEYKQDWLRFGDIQYLKQYMSESDHREYVYELAGPKRQMRRFTADVLERVNGEATRLLFSFIGIDNERAQTIRLHRQLADQKQILDYFINSYETAYIMNHTDGSVEILHMSPRFAKIIKAYGASKDAMTKFIADNIHPDDKEMMKQINDSEYVRNRLRKEPSFTFTMRGKFGGEERMMRGLIIRISDDDHIAVGFEDITDEVAEREQQQVHNKLIGQMMGDDGLFIIDCVNDRRQTVHDRCDGADNYDDKNGYLKSISQYVRNCVAESDRKMMREATSMEYMLEHTKGNKEYTVEYRDISTGTQLYYRMRIARFSDTEVLQSFRECDEEVVGRIVRDTLIDEYDALYVLDLERNEIRPARPSRVTDVGVFNTKINYKDVAMKFADAVDPHYKDDWVRFSDVKYMKEYMVAENHREYVYVLPGTKKSLRRFSVDVLDRVNGEAKTLLLSFMGIDDLRAETILLHRQLADQTKELEDALTVAKEEVHRTDILYEASNSAKWLYKIDDFDNIVGGEYSEQGTGLVHLVSEKNPLGWMDHIHSDDKENVFERFWATVHDHTGKTPYDVSFRLVDKDGKTNWTKASGRLMLLDNGRREFIGMSINITAQIEEQERQQKALKEAYDAAQMANEAKTIFLNNMSHDIRTPMNAIIGYTSMAKKYISDRKQVEDYLEKIGMAGNTLLTLINQVLDMSRIEAGKITLVEEPADVVDKAYEVAEIMQHAADVKNIKITTVIDKVRNRKVYADGGRMNQLILNILGNAIKYTPEFGKITYTLSQKKCDRQGYGTYVVCIEDTGIGMSPEYIKTIFEPFSREMTSTVSKIQGTGLGMTIVKKLVDLMGGTIDIESEPGEGTKVSVTMTFRLQENEEDNETTGQQDIEATTNVGQLKGKHILLVEDNEMNREIATMILEEHDMTVETAEDGDIAVGKIQALAECGELNHFDAVLMDIQMPRMNGYEATKVIRETVPEFKTPIIAVSANAFEEDRKLSREAGMNDHIAKPINVEELLHTLAKFI